MECPPAPPTADVAPPAPEEWPDFIAPRSSRAPWVFAALAVIGATGYVALAASPTPEEKEPTGRPRGSASAGEVTAALEVPTEDAPAAPLAAPGAAAEVAAAPSPAVDASADPAVEVGRVDARPVDDGAGAPRSPLPPWGRLGAGASVVPDAGDETTGASAGCRCDAATRSPGSLAHEAPRMSPRFFDAARQQLDAGRAWAALARFKRAVATAPKDPNAWFGLALARTDLGQTSLARKAARRALAVDPAHAGATLLLGFLAQQQHDVAAARQLYAHYLELEPEGPWAAEVQAVIAQLP